MHQVREADEKKRRRTVKGVPGVQGPERRGGPIHPQKALSPIPRIGLAERGGDPGRDPKTGDDLDLVPAPAAESIQEGGSKNEGARKEMTAERETVKEDVCQKTRDVVGLAQNHVPGLDQRTINVVILAQNHAQNHGPDPGKGGKTTHDCNNLFSPIETR